MIWRTASVYSIGCEHCNWRVINFVLSISRSKIIVSIFFLHIVNFTVLPYKYFYSFHSYYIFDFVLNSLSYLIFGWWSNNRNCNNKDFLYSFCETKANLVLFIYYRLLDLSVGNLLPNVVLFYKSNYSRAIAWCVFQYMFLWWIN